MGLFKFVKKVFSEYGQDKGGQMAAAFAYIAIFSIGPLLLVLISLLGFVLGTKAVEGKLYDSLASSVGPNAAHTIQNVVAHTHQSGDGAIAFAIGSIGVVLGAIGLTNQLQSSFNQILRVVPDAKAGVKLTIYTKIKNILLLIMGSLVVLVSLVVSAVFNAIGRNLNVNAFGLEVLNSAVSLLVFVFVLYLIYRVLPDVKVPRKPAFSAALVVSALFLVAKILLEIIIGHNGTASAYGAAASLVTLLIWFYYTGQILLFGAEGLKVYALNNSVTYDAKRFNKKRKSLNVDVQDKFSARLLEAFSRGYKSKSQK
jgi:membrane protein